jgi:hypothetical protein
MAKITLTVEQGQPLQINVEDAASPEQVLMDACPSTSRDFNGGRQ